MRMAWLASIGTMMVSSLLAQVDPPSRVARVNFLAGEVSFQPAGLDDWVAAPINRPLTTGDRLWIADRSRAELHIGSTAVRANQNTGFSFANLDDRTVQISLSQGTLDVHLRRLDEDQVFEIDTPNLAFSLLRPGEYRIDVDQSGESSLITVRGGEGEATGGGQAFPVRARQQARVTGTGQFTFDVFDAPPPDGWDAWCRQRDRREDQAQSARYVSREVIGVEDLDEHGSWRAVGDYGMVWYPRTVVAGWAPYRFGHWAWIEPWGWTWVDDAPWGFAPFHYGRWVFVAGEWGWVPGPVAPRPVYAPALVAFVGGPRFSLSLSIGGGGGGVAWFPLGPGDVYIPAHHASEAYFTRVNVSNTVVNRNVNITQVYNTTVINNRTTVINNNNVTYVNRTAPGAVTAVPSDAFVHSRPVGQAAVAVRPADVESAQVSMAAPVAPSRQSLLGPNAPAASRPPASVTNRAVVAKAPPPPAPVPFSARQQSLSANPGRPLAPETMRQMQQQRPMERPGFRQADEAQPAAAPAPPRRPAEWPAEPRPERPRPVRTDNAEPIRPAIHPAEERPLPPPRPAEIRREERPTERPKPQPAPRDSERKQEKRTEREKPPEKDK